MFTKQKIQTLLIEYQQIKSQCTSFLGFYFKWALTYVTALFIAIGWFMGKVWDSSNTELALGFWIKVQNSLTLQFLILSGIIINASFLLLPSIFVLYVGSLSRYINKGISHPLSNLLGTKVIGSEAAISSSVLVQICFITAIFLWLVIPIGVSYYGLSAFRENICMSASIFKFYKITVYYNLTAVALAILMLISNAMASLLQRRNRSNIKTEKVLK